MFKAYQLFVRLNFLCAQGNTLSFVAVAYIVQIISNLNLKMRNMKFKLSRSIINTFYYQLDIFAYC